MILTGRDVVAARHSSIAEVAGVKRLLEAQIRGLDVLLCQIGGKIVGHNDGIVSLIEVCQVAAVFHKTGENLPAQAVTQCEPAVDLVFILAEEAVLPRRSGYVGAGHRKEDRCGQPFKKVAESVAGKRRLEGKLTEIIGGQERLDVGVANSAGINTSLQSVLASRPAQIVGELCRLRLCDSGLVAADGSEPSSGAEVERRKSMRGGVLADVYAGQIEL